MLEFACANQQCNADFGDDFEFMMPNAVTSACESFREIEDYSLSPADELFYRGQLLPLLLPCRLKMVQELCTSETGPSILSSKKEDSDLKVPCFSANRHAELPSKVPCFSANCQKDLPSTQKDQSNMNVAILKPRLRWKVLFRRGKRCSLIEATCCHFTRSRGGIRNEASKVECIDIESYASAFRRSGSSSGGTILSPKRPRRTLSSSSSSAFMHRNPSINSRSLRDKGSKFAMKGITSKATAQKESLVLKARDCIQRSLKVLKLARSGNQKDYQNRANLLKQQHDYQGLHNTNVAKKRSQVAHCELSSSRLDDENVYCHMGAQKRSSSCPKEDTYWDLHLTEFNVSKRSWVDSMLVDDEEDEHSNAAFITLEPAFPQKTESQCNPSSDLDCNASCPTVQSLNSNFRSHYYEVHDSIQGAIAHCKASV